MMAVILLGLGIDFSIHIISGFTEQRAAGDSIVEAMEKTFLKSRKRNFDRSANDSLRFLNHGHQSFTRYERNGFSHWNRPVGHSFGHFVIFAVHVGISGTAYR